MILAVALNIGYIYLMSRQPELLAKISVVLIELFMILATLGFIYAGFQTKGLGQMAQRRNGLYFSALVTFVIFLIFNCMLYCYYT